MSEEITMEQLGAGANALLDTMLIWFRENHPNQYQELIWNHWETWCSDEDEEYCNHTIEELNLDEEPLRYRFSDELVKKYTNLSRDDIYNIMLYLRDTCAHLALMDSDVCHNNKTDEYTQFYIKVHSNNGNTEKRLALSYLPSAINVNSGNGYAIIHDGYNEEQENLFSLVTQKIDTSGEVFWERVYDGPKRSWARCVEKDLIKLTCRWESATKQCRYNQEQQRKNNG